MSYPFDPRSVAVSSSICSTSYDVKFHHVWNKAAFDAFFNRYKIICLSDNQERFVEDLLAYLVIEINCFFTKTESVSLISKDVELAVKRVIIVNLR